MWTLIVKGGPVMAPILIGSIVGLAIVLERLAAFRKIGAINAQELAQRILGYLKSDDIPSAMSACDAKIGHPIAAVFKEGIEKRQLPADRLEKHLQQAGIAHIESLEKNLGALASIVSIEPLMGFLGTITGLIRAFMSWEKAGANVTVNALAGGIYEAMITTAAGLIIAIPLFLFYNYFINRIKHISCSLNTHALELLETLSRTGR